MYQTLAQKINQAIYEHSLPEILQTIENHLNIIHLLEIDDDEEHGIMDELIHSISATTEIACKFEALHKTRHLFVGEWRDRQLEREQQEERESAA